MDNIERIEKLLKKNNGIITTREVEEIGINSRVLTRMIKKGIIERVARGIYISADTLEDKYFITQAICKRGIFSNETALCFWGHFPKTSYKPNFVKTCFSKVSLKAKCP